MRHLLEPHRGALSFARMRAAAADHLGAPFAICRHPDPSQPEPKRTMTVGAVLIDLEGRTMHVANGPPCANDYVGFGL
jgi:isopenicillin-N N-acyltransferase-like protein